MIKKFLKNEFFWLILIILFALFLRLWRITEIPPGLTGDEAWSGLDAIKILQNGWIGPFVKLDAWGQNTFFFYILSPFVKILGNTILSLRLLPALIGTITLIVIYFLNRKFLPPKAILLGIFLFSFNHWHLHFSRMSFMLIMVPLFSTLMYLSVLKGLEKNQLKYFLLAGIFFGLGLNTYPSFFYTAASFLIFFFLIFIQRKNHKKFLLKGLLLFLISAIIICLPLISYWTKNPDFLSGRVYLSNPFSGLGKENFEKTFNITDVKTVDIIKINLIQTLGIFHFKGDLSSINNLSGYPLLDLVTGLLFLLGLAILLLKKNKARVVFLPWFLMSLVAGITTADAPNARRVIDTLPSLIFMTSLGINFILEKLKRFRLWLSLGLSLIILCSFLINYQLFFVKYPQNSQAKFWFAYNQVKMCEYLKNNYKNYYVYFFSDFWSWDYETRRFLCPNIQGENLPKNFTDPVIKTKGENEKMIYILFPPFEPYLSNLKKSYNGKLETVNDEDGHLLFFSYIIN